MKVSEITVLDLAEYIRVELEGNENTLTAILSAAKSYIMQYTALTEIEMDKYAELVIAVEAISADMYDNRGLTAEKAAAENPTVKSILTLHDRNFF